MYKRFRLAHVRAFPVIMVFLLVLAGCGGGSSPGPQTSPGPSGIIVISGANPTHCTTYYGQNYWCWSNYSSNALPEVESQVQELHVNVIRAGGDNNDDNTSNGYYPFDYSQIDKYVAYCNAIGAQPILQVPVLLGINGSNDIHPTAQEAADIVTYCNVTKGYGIKYWEIGNEPDCYPGNAFGTGTVFEPSSYTVSNFCTTFNSFSEAMKAVDSSIKILGPEMSWAYYPNSDDWLTPFLQQCGSHVDIISLHRYPFAENQCTIANALSDNANFQTVLQGVRNVINSNPSTYNFPLAITEANISWDGNPTDSIYPASPQTFYAGLWLADSLGTALENNLWAMGYWDLCESWTLSFISYPGYSPRPTYYAYQMYTTLFGSSIIKATSVPSNFSVYASRSSDNTKTILMVINKNSTRNSETIQFTNYTASVPNYTYNFPAYSITCLQIPDSGAAPHIWNYTATMSAPQQIQ